MSQLFVKEENFDVFHLTTTKVCGNMQDLDLRRQFCNKIGIEYNKIISCNQVHGTNIQKVTQKDCGSFIENCDGLITDTKDIFLCIRTADCMPVFMVSQDKKCIALVHAGWRGLAGGIIEKAVAMFLTDFGVSSQNIIAYIGPHIKQCCYQVGADLQKTFGMPQGQTNLSLADNAKARLNKLNISQVYISTYCTYHNDSLFYSYRRNPSNDRIISLIKI